MMRISKENLESSLDELYNEIKTEVNELNEKMLNKDNISSYIHGRTEGLVKAYNMQVECFKLERMQIAVNFDSESEDININNVKYKIHFLI
jgi:hypothetical protein